jgi:hypothetical protein
MASINKSLSTNRKNTVLFPYLLRLLIISLLFSSFSSTSAAPLVNIAQKVNGANGVNASNNNWIIHVRRDTSYGLPYGSVHSSGISDIVWGTVNVNSDFTIKLERNGHLASKNEFHSDSYGNFVISVDVLISDGDVIVVSDNTVTKTVTVPFLSYFVDPATKIITGSAPANITSTIWNDPHTLTISIAGTQHQVTTDANGNYSASFSDLPYIAGLLGSMYYTTPERDQIYQPIFIADKLVRGTPSDWRADVILGQPDFGQITNNQVVNYMAFNPVGVLVDRSVRPNRVYVYDSGNSRVLGFNSLGYAKGGPESGQPCTSNSDHPGSICKIKPDKPADIIIGQSRSDSSECNGDSGYQNYPDAPLTDASLLCGLREEQNSIGEGWSGATMDTDSQGNFYVVDVFNNRVLKYNNPFTTDTIADMVWGQASFTGIHCNRGKGYSGITDARSLCLAPPPGYSEIQAGVDIDYDGNLWVADNMNNRVLRFPFDPISGQPAETADLVLGQPNFSINTEGNALSQMNNPASVRVDQAENVYVADSRNSRILLFRPPLTNGMNASQLFGNGWKFPTGLEFSLDGGVWVNDTDLNKAILVKNGVNNIAIPTGGFAFGGMGIDIDNNLLITFDNQVQHYASPNYGLDSVFLKRYPQNTNKTGGQGFAGGVGLEVTTGQLIYSDWSRLLFWNNPLKLINYQIADGVIGEMDFETRSSGGFHGFGRLRADTKDRLWALKGGNGGEDAKILAYKLPLKTGDQPIITISSPLKLKGGGNFSWTWWVYLGGIAYQPSCDCLWLSDSGNNRVFRIRDVSSSPLVDIILGQLNINGVHCNQGRDSDDGYVSPKFPAQDSLCHPGALSFDNKDNLFVSDNNLEVAGNQRLLEFNASAIPEAPAQAVFGIPASFVFGRGGSFTNPNCDLINVNPMCAPWEPAFDLTGKMVIGFNSYFGSRFPLVYKDILTNPLPIAALADLHSQPLSARFDQFDNLYIIDHNRSRLLIYRNSYETYQINGTIIDTEGKPIPDVNVTISSESYISGSITDTQGVFILSGFPAGNYLVSPSSNKFSFQPQNRTVVFPGVNVPQVFIGTAYSTNYLPIIRH